MRKMIHEIASISPKTFFAEYAWTAVSGVCMALSPMVMERVFSCVLQAGSEGAFPQSLLWWFLCLLGVGLLSELSVGVSGYYGEVYADLVAQRLYANVNQKAGRLGAIDYERPEVLNRLEKAYSGAFSTRDSVHVVMDLLTLYLPYFLLYGWYLYRCSPVLPLALALIFAPVLLSQKLKGKLYAGLEEEAAPLRRRMEYFASTFSAREYVKETRALGATEFLKAHYLKAREQFNRHTLRTSRKVCGIDALTAALNAIGYIAVIALLLHLVLAGQLAVSAFAAVFASIRTAYENMDEIVSVRAQELSVALALSENYTGFMSCEEESRTPPNDAPIEQITLNDVSFAYPNGKTALEHVSFSAKRGECVAVVGENGSGKTTLAKLLTGVYVPSSGTVSVGDGSDDALCHIRGKSSQLFQQFNRYRLTVAENIAISDGLKADDERLDHALRLAGLDLTDAGVSGTQAKLGREFGGAELSGGQWQRLAIARAVYKLSDVLVLDEPTAAIDPSQESSLYRSFSKCCEGKISFLITHRLGLVKICDRIILMNNGQVEGIGTHQELLASSEHYQKLWNAQAGQYR